MANAPAGKVQLREKIGSAHAGVARRIRSGSMLLHICGVAGGGAVVDGRVVLGSEKVDVKPGSLTLEARGTTERKLARMSTGVARRELCIFDGTLTRAWTAMFASLREIFG